MKELDQMRVQPKVKSQSSPIFPSFGTRYSSGQEKILASPLMSFGLGHTQNQQVVRNDRTPHILLKSRPTRPGATGQTKGSFQPGDIRFDTGPEVSQLFKHPVTLDHFQHRQSSFPGKHDIFNPSGFGLMQVIPGGKTSIRSHLPGWALKEVFLPIQHDRKHGGVRRVASLHQTIQNQTRTTSGQKYLVTVLGLPATLDNDVGMTFKERNQLLGSRNLLLPEYPSLSLVKNSLEKGQGPFQLWPTSDVPP